jgi:putative transposase
MRNIRYEVGARYMLGRQTYVVKQLLPHDELVIENESTGIESTVQGTILKVFGAAKVEPLVTPGPNTTRVLERVEIDHTVLDILVVDAEDGLALGRPTLTYAIDDYSGMPVGLYVSFEPPNHEGDAGCISHGILPKGDVQAQFGTENPWPVYGVPERLVMDNGTEFIGHDLTTACMQLGITVERTELRSPTFKGSLERVFRDVKEGLLRKLPDTSFSSSMESDDDRGADAHEHTRITLPAFLIALHRFLIDVYAQSWHAVKGCVPAKRWQECIANGYVPGILTGAKDVRMLLAPTAKRRLQRAGIEFESIWYNSPELARLGSRPGTDKRVSIKYDPSDLAQVYVFVGSEGAQGGWLTVPALDQEYASGMSLWQHRGLKRYARAAKHAIDRLALSAAKLNLQQVIEGEVVISHGRTATRRQNALFLVRTTAHPVDTADSAPLTPSSIEDLVPPRSGLMEEGCTPQIRGGEDIFAQDGGDNK